ncbi:Cyanovirin-N [Biscogniauxia marginata]|nr:Cyanovirin-N [Biscogniauxia marginata]
MKSTTTTLLLFLLHSSIAAGGFYSECSPSWSLGYRGSSHFIVATCPGTAYANASSITSALSLGDCLANDEGSLEAQALGGAMSFCRDCHGVNGTAKLLCDCRETGGYYITSVINLDTVIENNNGILSCFGLPGTSGNFQGGFNAVVDAEIALSFYSH